MPGHQGNYRPTRSGRDVGPQNTLRARVEAGVGGRFARTVPAPSVGDRFGELTVRGAKLGPLGGILGVWVRCSCGGDTHLVSEQNLRHGKTTRCDRCAKLKSAEHRKNYYKYADIVPDDAHRRRLLNRVSACLTRCRPGGHKNYGSRGIRVFEGWRGGAEGRRKYLAYLVSLPGWDNPELEIDRIDVDKGYEPGNLRFAPRGQGEKRDVGKLQQRILELEACLRRCKCGAAQ